MTRHTRASTARTISRSEESANSSAGAATTRRSHRKSRNGCIECKKRHIRCDERQPSCTNCHIADRTCFFPRPTLDKQKQRPGQQNIQSIPPLPAYQQNNYSELDQTPDPLSVTAVTGFDTTTHENLSSASSMQLGDSDNQPANCHPGFPNSPNAISPETYTLQHMILLRHADTVPNFTGPDRSIVNIAIQHAVDSSYLLDEVLAFTAFYMAHLYPGSAASLRHLATELQTRALASFSRLTETIRKDDGPTAVPRFLFSAILGRHALAETLVYHSSDFHSFVDRFVECFHLNRGIKAVTPPARNFLHNSKIQPFLHVIISAQSKIGLPGNECDPLVCLMDSSDLSETSVAACRQAIHVLQLSFDTFRNLDEKECPEATSVFSVGVQTGFVDVLRKFQPEALVIFAYYGVLLHFCRAYWAFGDAGASMIRNIAGHLGSYWQEALAWPLHVLEAEGISRTQNLVPRWVGF